MKTSLSIFFILIISIISFGQTDGSGLRDVQPDKSTESQIDEILSSAGKSFKEGLFGLADNHRAESREKLDKSVEVFLTSGVNVRSNGKLQACYTQLIETVYRLEFPSVQQPPQIKPLAQTCGWNIDNGLADQVAKLSQPGQIIPTTIDKNSTVATVPQAQPTPPNGFSDQKFEPSPLDELSKIELTPEEQVPIHTESWKDISKRTGVSIKDLLAMQVRGQLYWRYNTNIGLSDCPMPALKNIMPGDSVARTEKTLNRKLVFTPDKSDGGKVGLVTAGIILPGTKIVRIRAFQNEIYDVAVIYSEAINWNGLSDFAVTSSNNLQLPNSWIFRSNFGNYRCKNFQMTALKVQNYYSLIVSDSEVDRKIYDAVEKKNDSILAQAELARREAERKRREKELEEQRKKTTFKP